MKIGSHCTIQIKLSHNMHKSISVFTGEFQMFHHFGELKSSYSYSFPLGFQFWSFSEINCTNHLENWFILWNMIIDSRERAYSSCYCIEILNYSSKLQTLYIELNVIYLTIVQDRFRNVFASENNCRKHCAQCCKYWRNEMGRINGQVLRYVQTIINELASFK